MRRLGFMVLAAALPVAAFAEDAVIRLEAKRGAEAAAVAAAGWAARFPDVVTFPLARGWVAIGLGPQERAEADKRLSDLKAGGTVPGDAFVAVPEGGVVLSPVAGTAAPVEAAPDAAPEPAASETPPETQPETAATSEPDLTPVETVVIQPDAPAPGTHIRLQSLQSQAEAEAVLAEWRKTFPEAGLWAMPGGWYGVTIGPMAAETAQAWLAAFKAGGTLPKDAFTSDSADLGRELVAGEAPDLPPPGEKVPMPPLDEVQRALRWAGHYEGDIDGKSGPMTQAAIAAEVAALRVSPDAGAAMQALIERRATWRTEMGLQDLRDAATGLALTAPMDKLQFDRAERSLSIYGPKDGSGAALILFSQPGGQQELLDLSGLVTALGWVPQPERKIERGHVLLEGANDDHSGRAEGWVRDGRAEGFVLIWPAADAQDSQRIAADMSDSLTRFAPAGNEAPAEAPAATQKPAAP